MTPRLAEELGILTTSLLMVLLSYWLIPAEMAPAIIVGLLTGIGGRQIGQCSRDEQRRSDKRNDPRTPRPT